MSLCAAGNKGDYSLVGPRMGWESGVDVQIVIIEI